MGGVDKHFLSHDVQLHRGNRTCPGGAAHCGRCLIRAIAGAYVPKRSNTGAAHGPCSDVLLPRALHRVSSPASCVSANLGPALARFQSGVRHVVDLVFQGPIGLFSERGIVPGLLSDTANLMRRGSVEPLPSDHTKAGRGEITMAKMHGDAQIGSHIYGTMRNLSPKWALSNSPSDRNQARRAPRKADAQPSRSNLVEDLSSEVI